MSGGRKDAKVLRVIRNVLLEGTPVVIEGVGAFRLTADNEIEFREEAASRVFIAYASEDEEPAGRLYAALKKEGLSPWRDKEKLLPGQNWPRAIERAIEVSDFFVACLSKNATAKRGYFQSELRYAIDLARRVPLEEVFIIPARLDRCPVPAVIGTETQYVDLFPDWNLGVAKMIRAIRSEANLRSQRLKLAG